MHACACAGAHSAVRAHSLCVLELNGNGNVNEIENEYDRNEFNVMQCNVM